MGVPKIFALSLIPKKKGMTAPFSRRPRASFRSAPDIAGDDTAGEHDGEKHEPDTERAGGDSADDADEKRAVHVRAVEFSLGTHVPPSFPAVEAAPVVSVAAAPPVRARRRLPVVVVDIAGVFDHAGPPIVLAA